MSTRYLYLDESGTFNDLDRSAIGGLWATEPITDAAARESLRIIYEQEIPREGFHATAYKGDRALILQRALEDWTTRGWHGVLFEHVSQRTVIDNATTYVNVFSEGLAKFARLIANEDTSSLDLQVLAANRSLPRADNQDISDRMPPGEYWSRIQERLALEHIRQPLIGANNWKPQLDFASATQDPRLMMADLLCNAWYNLSRSGIEKQKNFWNFIAPHHHLTLRADDAERIRLCLEQGDFVQALIDIGDHLAYAGKQLPSWLEKARKDVVYDLARLPSPVREAALRVSLVRLNHLVEHERRLTSAEHAIEQWRSRLFKPIVALLTLPADREHMHALEVESLRLALQTANHQGNTKRAAELTTELSSITPTLTRQFEHLPEVVKTRINEAVNLTNRFAFVEAFEDMNDLASRLRDVFGLFDELTGQKDQVLRSDLRGRALGTALQAARMAARRDNDLLERARCLSNEALIEFEQDIDRRRQAGYRFEIEADSGDLESAQAWLAKSIGLEHDASIRAIAVACIDQPPCKDQPFWLYHLAWLWARAVELQHKQLATAIAEAWKSVGLDQVPMIRKPDQHPGQGILWKLGIARAADCPDRGLSNLMEAIKACDMNGLPTIRSIGLGIRADRLAILALQGPENAYRRAVDDFINTRRELAKCTTNMAIYFGVWPESLPRRSGPEAARLWRAIARDIPY